MSEAYTPSVETAGFFDLVEHHYQPSNHRRAIPVFNFLFKNMRSRLKCRGLNELKLARENLPDEKKPVYIHIGRHLSEMDWAEAQVLLYEHDMGSLISMGDNLCVWPFGGFFRAMGAFVAVREERVMDGRKIEKKMAASLYTSYLHHVILNEGRDVLVYPEWTHIETENGRKTKYGRSYSGRLLEFSPLIFRTLKNIQSKTERPIMVVPHNASRERVIEDEVFSALAEMKKQGSSNRSIYMRDIGFIMTHWLYQSPGAVDFNFGEPIPVNDYDIRGMTDKARTEVARLQTVFPTHIMAYAMADDLELGADALENRMIDAISNLQSLGLRMDCTNAWKAMQKAYAQFYQTLGPFATRKIITADDGVIRVERPDVLHQYRDNARSLEETLRTS